MDEKKGFFSHKKYLLLVLFILLLIVSDQVTKAYVVCHVDEYPKQIIAEALNFSYVENTGGAFGVGQNSLLTFIITNIIVLGIIIRFMILQRERIDIKTNIVLGIILAGGMSNVIDRVVRGFVVDFIDIGPLITNFPKFNLADIYIILGWIFLALVFAMYTMKEIKQKNRRGEKS